MQKFEEILLNHPFLNGSPGHEIHPDGQKFMDLINEMGEVQKRGDPIYIKVLRGERKGSIAKFVGNIEHLSATPRRTSYSGDARIQYETKGTRGYFIWDGRRNKVKASIDFKSYAWLKNYDGPTIYERLNKKEVAKKEIKSNPQKDIDGKTLKVGDEVLYCNIRYGGGTTLSRGVVTEFKGKSRVDHNDEVRTSIYTIILNEDGEEESKIEGSHFMVKKVEW